MTAVPELTDDTIEIIEDWREHAACNGRLELFFARKAERPEARARREAKAQRLCDACAVRTSCRSFARVHREYGFWGGESEEERHMAGYTLTAPIGVRARLAAHDVEPSSGSTGGSALGR